MERRAIWLCSGTIVVLAMVSWGCVRLSPSHCGNQQGAQTCREQNKGQYCSICQSENDGCVSEPVEPGCGSETAAVDTDDTVASTGEIDASSTADLPQSTTAPDLTTTGPDSGEDDSESDTVNSGSGGGSGGDSHGTSSGGTESDASGDTGAETGNDTEACVPEGEPCTLLAGECCPGLTCLNLLSNVCG